MGIRIVRLGSPRAQGEGPRLGTVRRPPRGVPKAEFARRGFYDVWYPNLAPSAETMQLGQHAGDDAAWAAFAKRFRAERAVPDAARSIYVLATLSHGANFSLCCYCDDEPSCHRSILRALHRDRGAALTD